MEARVSLLPVVQAYVAYLEGQNTILRDRVATWQASVAKLQTQLADAYSGEQGL